MNRIERLTGILLLLQERPRTSQAIADHFEVSKRTILRDVQALCEMGVPVIAREGVGGGYALPDDYRLTPLPLTAHEAFLLLLALSSVTRLSDAPYSADLASLLAKLRALLPDGQWPQVEALLAAVHLHIPERHQPAPFLEPLIDAARTDAWLRVTYQSASRVSVQHLLPRRVYAQHGLWYLEAYAHEHGAVRTYRVDRVQTVEAPAPDFAPAPVETRPYDHPAHPEIRASLTPRGVAWLESEPDLGGQIQRRPDGSGTLALRCPPTEMDYFARLFARFGSEVEVHAPPELRECLLRLGQQLVTQYAKR